MGKKSRKNKKLKKQLELDKKQLELDNKQLELDKKEFTEKFAKALKEIGQGHMLTADASTYLPIAICYQLDEMIRLLSDKDYLGTDPNQNAVVHWAIEGNAAEGGFVSILNTLLSDSKINPYANGLCPTTEAYTEKNIEKDKVIPIIDVLLRHNIDIDGKDQQGFTILQHSIMKGTEKITDYLIEHGANINAQTIYYSGHKVTLLLFMLLQLNKLDEIKKDSSKTTLEIEQVQTKIKQYFKIFKYLLDKGADPNIKCESQNDMRTLYIAACLDETKYLKEILKTNIIDINAKDKKGYSALHYSIIKNNIKALECLIEKGANIPEDLPQFCIINNNIKALEYLIEKGANIPEDLLYDCIIINNIVALQFLLQKAACHFIIPKKSLYTCVEHNNIQAFELLLNIGAYSSIEDSLKHELFEYAWIKGNLEIGNFIGQMLPILKFTDIAILRIIFCNPEEKIQKFIDNYYHIEEYKNLTHKAITNMVSIIYSEAHIKHTPLNLDLLKKMCNVREIKEFLVTNNFFICDLATHGATQYLKYLTSKAIGADVNLPDENNIYPLLHAINNKNETTSITLIEKFGAKTNFRDADGATLLHISMLLGLVQLANVLYAYNPELSSYKDHNSSTIIDYAMAGGFARCIEWAIKHSATNEKDKMSIEPKLPENVKEKKSTKSTNDNKVTQDILEKFISSYTKEEKHQLKISAIFKQANKRLAEQKKQVLENIKLKIQQGKEQESWYVSDEQQYQEEDCIPISITDEANHYVVISEDSLKEMTRQYKGQADHIIKQFENAILNGYVGTSGENGIKKIAKSLIELKVIGQASRLYTKIIYQNENGATLIVFDQFAKNHLTIEKEAFGSNIELKKVKNSLIKSPNILYEAQKVSYDKALIEESLHNIDFKAEEEYKQYECYNDKDKSYDVSIMGDG